MIGHTPTAEREGAIWGTSPCFANPQYDEIGLRNVLDPLRVPLGRDESGRRRGKRVE